MKIHIDLSTVPAEALEFVHKIAAEQGETLRTEDDIKRYLNEDEEALEVVLAFIDIDL